MTFERKIVKLASDVPGTTTELHYFHIGPANAPEKVYLQAALHADEQPGTLVLHHLLPMLQQADEQGLLRARFVVMPMVNPLGMANMTFHEHVGRYDFTTGINYNRLWPDLFAALRSQLAGRLSDDERFNVNLIRKTISQWLDAQHPATGAAQLRLLALKECHDAEFILDLHCDNDALLHIFTATELMPELQDLADWMGAAVVLTTAESGGGSFEEVLPTLYRKIAAANPGKPVPMASAAATLEYRGRADSFDHFAEQDALRLFGFLAGRGLIDADPGPRPESQVVAAPFEATEMVRVDRPGLIAYRLDLGQRVKKGEPIADLIALDGPEAFTSRTPILAGTDGFLLSRRLEKYAIRGAPIAKIVGTTPLPHRKGNLLQD